MIMRPDIIYKAYNSIEDRENAKVIYMSPKGKVLNQRKVIELKENNNHLIIICGHYEGIDQRIIDKIVDEQISIGNFVLTGGELPAMCLVDSVSRYVEGVLNKDSISEESFSNLDNEILEYPQYTRPYDFEGSKVPDILLSGNHEEVNKWRKEQSLIETQKLRPDLLKKEK